MAYSGANGVGYVAASALGVLASVDDLDIEVGVLVEDLLYTTVVAALLGLDSTRLRQVLVVVIVLVIAVLLVVVEGLVVVGRFWSVIVGCGLLRTARTRWGSRGGLTEG
jgi:ABC-type transport system involved in cytochrome c biogenesis permease subunit